MFLFLTKIDGEVVSRGIDGKSLNTGLFVELTKKKKLNTKITIYSLPSWRSPLET